MRAGALAFTAVVKAGAQVLVREDVVGALMPPVSQEVGIDPARWGYSAAMSTINVDGRATPRPDALWEHTAGNWFLCVGMLGALTVVAVLATSLLLRRVGAEQ